MTAPRGGGGQDALSEARGPRRWRRHLSRWLSASVPFACAQRAGLGGRRAPGLQAPWVLGDPAGTKSSGSLDRAEALSFFPPGLAAPVGVIFMEAGRSLGALGSRGPWPGLRVGHPSTLGSDREERLEFAADDSVTGAVMVPASWQA